MKFTSSAFTLSGTGHWQSRLKLKQISCRIFKRLNSKRMSGRPVPSMPCKVSRPMLTLFRKIYRCSNLMRPRLIKDRQEALNQETTDIRISPCRQGLSVKTMCHKPITLLILPAINSMEEGECRHRFIHIKVNKDRRHLVSILACPEVDHNLILVSNISATKTNQPPAIVEDQHQAKASNPTLPLKDHNHFHSSTILIQESEALLTRVRVKMPEIMGHIKVIDQVLVTKTSIVQVLRAFTHLQKLIAFKMWYKMRKNWLTILASSDQHQRISIEDAPNMILEEATFALVTWITRMRCHLSKTAATNLITLRLSKAL